MSGVYAHAEAGGWALIVNVIGAAGESFPAGYIAGAAGNASLMAFTRALGKGAPTDGLRVVADQSRAGGDRSAGRAAADAEAQAAAAIRSGGGS